MAVDTRGYRYRLDEPIQLAPPDSPFVAVGQRRGFVRIVSEEYDIRLLVWQPLGNARAAARTHVLLAPTFSAEVDTRQAKADGRRQGPCLRVPH